ncbi:nitrilase-related carbon-nitrogen hydrolase [uncultured Leifsonia sp.]|uniref:nitrilase-related carbon-nitrogen hydrolase n=1 Tax=uncultured Leifsonia sp. TaxID=340359 RepID=UPI0028D03277|nr:nitrilase-related carbon-nitrogen hydrolase [uncultured Leifsonia sp.]
MRLALGQLASTDDVAGNLRAAGDAVARAADAGADLLLLPEYAMYEKKTVDATFGDAAEPLDGPFCSAIAGLAAEHGVAVVAGVVERAADGGRPFNTLAAFGSDGALLARYRKIHLFDSYGFRESEWIAPAPDPEAVVFDVAGLTVGLMTCYDLRFPELGRALADAGAALIACCSSWVPGAHKAEQWRVLAQARAIENGCFTAAVSQAEPISIGRSILTGPQGETVAEAGAAPQLLVADVDAAEVAAARDRDPALRLRRL